MSRENFAVEILKAPVQMINRAEWLGSGRIPEVTTNLARDALLSVTTPFGFAGRIEVRGSLTLLSNSSQNHVYRWSQTARSQESARALLILKYDDCSIDDIVVAVQMRQVSDIVIKHGNAAPFLTAQQILAAIGLGLVGGFLLMPVFALFH